MRYLLRNALTNLLHSGDKVPQDSRCLIFTEHVVQSSFKPKQEH